MLDVLFFIAAVIALIWTIIYLIYDERKKRTKKIKYLTDKILKYYEYEQYHGPTTFKIPMEQLLEDFEELVHES
jgi:hypothetical protein